MTFYSIFNSRFILYHMKRRHRVRIHVEFVSFIFFHLLIIVGRNYVIIIVCPKEIINDDGSIGLYTPFVL